MEREGRRDEFSRVLVKVPEVSRFQLVIAWDVVWQVMTVSELEAMIRWRGSLARIRDWKWVSCRRALRRAVSSGLGVGVLYVRANSIDADCGTPSYLELARMQNSLKF